MALGTKLLHMVVRNDAMSSDPPQIYNHHIFYLVLSSCFGGMLFGWETGAIGGVLAMTPTLEKFGYGNSTEDQQAWLDQNIVSTLQGGAFIACFLIGPITEAWGRRWCLVGAGTTTVVGVVLQVCSSIRGTLPLMYVGRFVAGLGVGSCSSLVPLYVSECAPRAIRGGLISCYQLFLCAGIMLAFWVNYGSSLHFNGDAIFMVPLAMQGLPAALMVLGMLFCPESPRWVARKDDWERVAGILVDIRGLPVESDYVREELAEIHEQLAMERQLMGGSSTWQLFKEMVTVPSNRRRTLIVLFPMIWQQLTGVNSINYYAPQIFANLGMSGTEASLFSTGIYGILKTVAVAVFIFFFADTLGRRMSLIWTSGAMAICMIIIGTYGAVQPPVEGAAITPFGYVAITCIYLWAAFYQLGWGPVPWVLMGEVPTARLRGLSVSMGAATQWLFNFIIARTVLTMQNTMGTAGFGMFYMFGGFCIVMGIFAFLFVPETKGLSLEGMDELFGVVNEQVKKLDEENDGDVPQPRPVSVHDAAAGKP